MHYGRWESALLAAVAGLAVGGCGTDEIYRKIALEPSVNLPTGSAALAGDVLSVAFGGVEPLAIGNRFVVWAGTASGPVALGESDTAGIIAATLTDFGLTAADIQLVIVSEEDDGVVLPSTLLGALYLQGPVDGELHFAGHDPAELEATTGEAELLNKEMTLHVVGLPSLLGGFSYVVWMMFPAEYEETHGDGSGHGHGDSGGEMEMIEMGELGGGGTLEARGDRILALGSTIVVTVESDNGVPMMSSSSMLTGQVVTEAQGGAAPADEGGGNGGEHMH